MWLQAAAALLNSGAATNATRPPTSAPTNAETAVYGPDASGWNVNFSGIQSNRTAQDKSQGVVPGFNMGGGADLGGVPWWAIAALGGALLWRMRASKK